MTTPVPANTWGIAQELYLATYRRWRDKRSTCSQNAPTRRRQADGTPIEFKITLTEWMKLWIDSGHIGQGGRTKGSYVVSRFNDVGDYEIGNVFIQTFEENVRQAQSGKPKSAGQKAKVSELHTGFKNEILTCPHCAKQMGANNIYKRHFDNCASKL